VEKEFTDLRALLLLASSCQKPDDAGFGDLLGPLQKDILAITKLKEANRKDREWFTHLSTIAEGAPCAGWVTVVSSHVLSSSLQLLIHRPSRNRVHT
jgi:adenylyl cyclase-associated protein